MARPKLDIDSEQVEKLAALGCKNKEIADFFGCSEETICNRFSNELTKGRANVRISLRRWQLECAKKGNASLLIWLGKQMLGQRDEEIDEKDARKAGEVVVKLDNDAIVDLIKKARDK